MSTDLADACSMPEAEPEPATPVSINEGFERYYQIRNGKSSLAPGTAEGLYRHPATNRHLWTWRNAIRFAISQLAPRPSENAGGVRKPVAWRAPDEARPGRHLVTEEAFLLQFFDGHEPLFAADALGQSAAERDISVEVARMTAAHEEEPEDGSMAVAAACYAYPQLAGIRFWPWAPDRWKSHSKRRDGLVKAAALLIKEIERVDRLSGKQKSSMTAE